MELLEQLGAVVEREGLPSQGAAARVGADVCDALAACHAAGIIHRDVKPSNVFRAEGGAYKLGDFGLSRSSGALGSASSKSVAGTPAYMAPEVQRRHYGARADLYSLGVMLYRWLNGGRPPFVDAGGQPSRAELEAAETRRMRGERPPAPAGDGVDPALAAIVLRAVEPDPADRWPSAAAMGEALEGWLAGTGAGTSWRDPEGERLRREREERERLEEARRRAEEDRRREERERLRREREELERREEELRRAEEARRAAEAEEAARRAEEARRAAEAEEAARRAVEGRRRREGRRRAAAVGGVALAVVVALALALGGGAKESSVSGGEGAGYESPASSEGNGTSGYQSPASSDGGDDADVDTSASIQKVSHNLTRHETFTSELGFAVSCDTGEKTRTHDNEIPWTFDVEADAGGNETIECDSTHTVDLGGINVHIYSREYAASLNRTHYSEEDWLRDIQPELYGGDSELLSIGTYDFHGQTMNLYEHRVVDGNVSGGGNARSFYGILGLPYDTLIVVETSAVSDDYESLSIYVDKSLLTDFLDTLSIDVPWD